MADADQDQCVPCDEVVASSASHSTAVSQLFREHNRALLRYLTARLQSEQEAKEVAQEAYLLSPAVARARYFHSIARVSLQDGHQSCD